MTLPSSTPRWFLMVALAAAAGVSAWGAGRWVSMVEKHVVESTSGYQRIAALEARVVALEAQASWCRRVHGRGEDR